MEPARRQRRPSTYCWGSLGRAGTSLDAASVSGGKETAMPPVRHLRVVLVAAALASGLAACSSSSKSSGGANAITIQSFSFTPNPFSAKVGDTITVNNKDKTHNKISADDSSFNVGPWLSW